MTLVSAKSKNPKRRPDPDPALFAKCRILVGGADGRTFYGGGDSFALALADGARKAASSSATGPWWAMQDGAFLSETDVADAIRLAESPDASV